MIKSADWVMTIVTLPISYTNLPTVLSTGIGNSASNSAAQMSYVRDLSLTQFSLTVKNNSTTTKTNTEYLAYISIGY